MPLVCDDSRSYFSVQSTAFLYTCSARGISHFPGERTNYNRTAHQIQTPHGARDSVFLNKHLGEHYCVSSRGQLLVAEPWPRYWSPTTVWKQGQRRTGPGARRRWGRSTGPRARMLPPTPFCWRIRASPAQPIRPRAYRRHS